ncbi:hypothetical protein FSPOR_2844 [Fusarium sporotrichioides]|uniref:Arrestin-like N-terminal domain-containing protein n=1 Tax=Fusarium sporotrichioides TaxID=5514 RepID=A0A395SJA9_FUSSP|nr:hypothetical protein FSPOR_2844 [Fusarium sporotrichioides]
MRPSPLKSNPWLGIHLVSDTYAPGDTITGYVYRKTPISTPDALVSCCLHGGASVDSNHDLGMISSFTLLTCHGESNILYRGPLRIQDNNSERWSFSLKVPIYADSTTNASNTFTSFTQVGATDHQLPPTYALYSADVIGIFVEYFVSVKLIFDVHERTQMLDARHPFKLVQYSPHPPIADFALGVWRYPRSMRGTHLIPGIQRERASLFGWTKRSLSRTDGPIFTYDLLFGFPTRIQLDNPTPIPLRLVVFPKWEETTDIIQNVPQKCTLLSIKVLLVTRTKIMTRRGREKYYTNTVDLGVPKAMSRLQNEILIPCVSSWDPVDIGEMINLRIGLQETGFPYASKKEEFTPSFRTYNMTVTHRIQCAIKVKVAGESFSVKGEANVLLLRSSDEREQSSRGQDASTMDEDLDTELGIFEAEEDDSWIRPPPEDDAPPSFADIIVMGRDTNAQER